MESGERGREPAETQGPVQLTETRPLLSVQVHAVELPHMVELAGQTQAQVGVAAQAEVRALQ